MTMMMSVPAGAHSARWSGDFDVSAIRPRETLASAPAPFAAIRQAVFMGDLRDVIHKLVGRDISFELPKITGESSVVLTVRHVSAAREAPEIAYPVALDCDRLDKIANAHIRDDVGLYRVDEPLKLICRRGRDLCR
jgi:hypothetical protein